MMVALDTNCFIDAFRPSSHVYTAMNELLSAHEFGLIQITVSRQSLNELEQSPDQALSLARKFEILPHFPLGSWNDQVATWDQLEGTWNDARRNDEIQQELKNLAKAGNDIRDRGAYIDALRAGVDVFVTSDKQFVASSPAKRIENRFGLRVLSPEQLYAEICA